MDVDGWMGRVPFSFLYATADAAISPSASSGAGRAVTYVSIALCRSKLSCLDHSDLSRALLIICASVLQPIRGLPPKHNSCTVSRRAALSRFHIWTIINSDIFTHNRALKRGLNPVNGNLAQAIVKSTPFYQKTRYFTRADAPEISVWLFISLITVCMPLIICAEEFLDCSTSESLISHPRHYRNLSEMCSDAEVSRFGASSYRFLKTVTRYSKKPDQKVCILSLFLGFQACSLSPVSKQNLTELS